MTDILNLHVKDDVVKNIISNNPLYVDVKGSVNICLIRCGQEIDKCNSVNFTSMTNYSKILVLNPNEKNISKCNIKMAFDTTNDNTNNDGGAEYKFERVFFTVPSLHKLNGQIFDMETFIVFSSTQKNGNILYVCLCSLSMITPIVQSGDWKLLNYKLLNELFTKNNMVPDIFGTNPINGIPNPVDINNFIPQPGFRNFYDYTHPLNTKVNFRLYQTPLAVSNDVINLLKSKLTPGNVYENFKNSILKTINPHEGLFFYFSEDLTNRYKSLEANKIKKEELYPEIEDESNETLVQTSKLVDKVEDESKEEPKETFAQDSKLLPPPKPLPPAKPLPVIHFENNKSMMFIFFIISFLLIVNIGYLYFMNNFFPSNDKIDITELPNYLNEIYYNITMKEALRTKISYYSVTIFQGIMTLIIIILLIAYICNSDRPQGIYQAIFTLISFIVICGIIMLYLFYKYFILRFNNIYDDDFTQKETYLLNYVFKDFFSNAWEKIYKIVISGDFEYYIKYKSQVGGSIDTIVPGPNESIKEHNNIKNKELLSKGLFEGESIKIISKKIYENNNLKTNFYKIALMIIGFFILGSILQLK